MRKRLAAMLVATTVLMTVAVGAQAQETDASMEGKGSIWAKGSGVAILDGGGRVQMAIDGDVVIYEYAGDAVVKIGAVPEEEPDGEVGRLQEVSPTSTYTLDDFRGRMQVVGSGIRIEAEGDMKFRARGEGSVELDGRGWWKTRRARGAWNGTGLNFGGAGVEEG